MKMTSVKQGNNFSCLVHQRKTFHREEMEEANERSSESSDKKSLFDKRINQTQIGDEYFN